MSYSISCEQGSRVCWVNDSLKSSNQFVISDLKMLDYLVLLSSLSYLLCQDTEDTEIITPTEDTAAIFLKAVEFRVRCLGPVSKKN